MNPLPTILCCLSLLFATVSWAGPYEDAEQKYSFGAKSTYQELLTAFNKSYKDFEADHQNPIAMFAMDRALGYVKPEDKPKFSYDCFLQQNELIAKGVGVNGILRDMDQGIDIPPVLAKQISDKICQDLKAYQPQDKFYARFAFAGVNLLVRLLDDRGLDMFLTEAERVRLLERMDKWDSDWPAAKYAEMKQGQKSKDDQHASDRDLLAVYELCERRKAAGAGRIVSVSPVVDLSKLRPW